MRLQITGKRTDTSSTADGSEDFQGILISRKVEEEKNRAECRSQVRAENKAATSEIHHSN